MKAPFLATVAPVAALGLALSLAACSGDAPEPSAASLTPAPITSDAASPSASPDAHEIVSGADVAILERLENPTTGEVWHEPVPIANQGLLAYPDFGIADDYLYYEVGTHGDAAIVAAIPSYSDWFTVGRPVTGLFEVDASGARMITCPSSRGADTCVDWSTDWEAPGRSLDAGTHYDTLTYRERVSPLPGWEFSIARLASGAWAGTLAAYGDGSPWPGVSLTTDDIAALRRDERIDLVPLGDSTLVEFRAAATVPGLTDSRFAIETPYGGIIPSESSFTSAYYGQGAVTWTDGVDTFTHPSLWGDGDEVYPVRSASLACFGPDETIAEDFDPAEWEVAGTHRLGFDVYVPADGGNAIAQSVYETERDNSWGDVIDEVDLSYPYVTYEDFLAARSVFAWERPDGEWVIAIDGFALQRVYECA